MHEDTKATAIISVAVVLGLGIVGGVALKGCTAGYEADAIVGKACVESGGAWVRTGPAYQCIRSK